jgi:predicted DNA-binding WGR domain protein
MAVSVDKQNAIFDNNYFQLMAQDTINQVYALAQAFKDGRLCGDELRKALQSIGANGQTALNKQTTHRESADPFMNQTLIREQTQARYEERTINAAKHYSSRMARSAGTEPSIVMESLRAKKPAEDVVEKTLRHMSPMPKGKK